MRHSRFPYNPAFRSLLALIALAALATTSRADEGMWLYNHPPRELILKKYGFELTAPWLEHLQKSSVRFGAGGSAEFVSEDGLVLSNHHVGARAVQRLSTGEHNYIRDGFYARTRAGHRQLAVSTLPIGRSDSKQNK